MCYAGSPLPGSPVMGTASPSRQGVNRSTQIANQQKFQAAGNKSQLEQMRKSGAIYDYFGNDQRLLRRVAQTEGREFDARDPYGDVAFSMAKQQSALDKKISDFDARQAQYEADRAKLGTISSAASSKGTVSSKQAKVLSSIGSRKATTKGQAATGLKTTYGTTTYGSTGNTGLNVAT